MNVVRQVSPWTNCYCGIPAVLQICEEIPHAGRRFFRCPNFMASSSLSFFSPTRSFTNTSSFCQNPAKNCNYDSWADYQMEPHTQALFKQMEDQVALTTMALGDEIDELQAKVQAQGAEIEQLRQEIIQLRASPQERTFDITSDYSPWCCCEQDFCICACHERHGLPRIQRPRWPYY